MKNNRMKYLVLLSFLIWCQAAVSQDVIVYTDSDKVETTITALGSNMIYTKDGSFQHNEVDSLGFGKREEKYKHVYERVKAIPHSFENNLTHALDHDLWKSRNDKYVEDMPYNKEGELVYSEVVETKLTDEQIYERAKSFFIQLFENEQDILKVTIENELIIARGKRKVKVNIGLGKKMTFCYSIYLDIKDEKYRFSFKDIELTELKAYAGTPIDDSNLSTSTWYDAAIDLNEIFKKENYYRRNGEPRNSNLQYKTIVRNELQNVIEDFKKKMLEKSEKDKW